MGEPLSEPSLVAHEINVADDTSSYCERCPLKAGLRTLEAGLNNQALVGVCLLHQKGLVLSYVPATRKEGIAMAFVDAQVLFGNVRRTPMLDKPLPEPVPAARCQPAFKSVVKLRNPPEVQLLMIKNFLKPLSAHVPPHALP